MSEPGEAWDYLHHLYHERKMTFGRDRLYKYAQANRPDLVAQGLSRRFVVRFLEAQECHQLFKPARTMPEVQSTVPLQPFNIVGMDLIDMHSMEVRGYTWALTAIDLFSRKGYCVPLKSKTAEEVVRGFALMLYGNTQQLRIHRNNSKDMSKWTITRHAVRPRQGILAPQMLRHPKHLRSDNGPELKNALLTYFLQNHTAREDTALPTTQHWTEPHTPQANGCCERFNGFLKRQIRMQVVQDDDNDWVSMLPGILHNINTTWCRVTNRTPVQVEQEYVEQQSTDATRAHIIKSMGRRNAMPSALSQQRFEVGDRVRVKLLWAKSAGLSWSHDVYRIAQVISGRAEPPYRHTHYKLAFCKEKGEKEEVVKGWFRNDDLQRYVPVDVPVKGKERFVIERLVKPVVRKVAGAPTQMFEVKWAGYKTHTEEPRATLLLDVPHLVKRFEKDHKVAWNANKQPEYEPNE
jgi:hypothetical protein